MADYTSSLLGLISNAINSGVDWMQDPRRTQQMQMLGGLLADSGTRAAQHRGLMGQEVTYATNALKKGNVAEALRGGPAGEQLTQAVANAYNPAGITVYHGSPYRFGRFDPTKIGSGEGAQAYGYGHYVAESPGVAEGYQKTLAHKAFDLSPEAGKRGLNLSAGARGEFMRQVRSDAPPEVLAKRLQNANISARELPQEKLADLFKAYKEQGGGALYTIDLPDPAIARMLNWDTPLSQQPKSVQSAFKKLGIDESVFPQWTGQQAYEGEIRALTEFDRVPKDIAKQRYSEQLRQQGIPGIRYLDEGSRGAGQGTSNFVVFPGEEDLLRILSVNGGLLTP